jgi:hypothetical protein
MREIALALVECNTQTRDGESCEVWAEVVSAGVSAERDTLECEAWWKSGYAAGGCGVI